MYDDIYITSDNIVSKNRSPPTPGPKKKEDIYSDARERFGGVILIQKESDFSVEDYLCEYDNWEKYSEIKSYSRRPYQGCYKGYNRQYQNCLCIITDENNIEEYYVVSKKLRGEYETLEKYCLCLNCTASRMNPLKYIWCPFCTGCIKSGPGFVNPEYISYAKNKKNIENNGDTKKIKSLHRYTSDTPYSSLYNLKDFLLTNFNKNQYNADYILYLTLIIIFISLIYMLL
jgi:hypothetical protein